MKVLLVNQFYPPNTLGGAGISVERLARGLRHLGIEVAVATLGSRDQVREWNGVRVHEVVARNMRRQQHAVDSPFRRLVWHGLDIRNRAMAGRLSAVIEEERPDLVHTNTIAGFSVAIWDRLQSLGLPVVHTIRDYYLLCPRATMFKEENCKGQCRICRPFSLPKRRSTRAVRHVVGISEFVLKRHRELDWFTDTPSSVIRNGVIPREPVLPAKPGEPIAFGYLGRLDRSKGVDRLLRTFAEAGLGDAVLRVAGKGEQGEVDRLRAIVPGPSVEFLGFVAPSELFARCDALIVPSLWHEPLGRIVLEAYAHGVPVLAARRGGIPEIVEEGRTGWLFEPDDHDEWVAKLREVSVAVRQPNTMREHCLAAAAQVTPERIAQEYTDLYESILGE